LVFQPNPNEPAAMFEGPVTQNCLTILTRDFKEGLDYYYVGEDLPDFQERTLGPPMRNVYPCLAVEPHTNRVEEADDRSHLVEVVRVRLFMAVTADGPSKVSELIMKYVRVAHLVLQTGRRDFFAGMSNPFEVVLGFSHLYSPAGEDENIILRAAIVEVTVGLRER
jgi:hypothetical protein